MRTPLRSDNEQPAAAAAGARRSERSRTVCRAFADAIAMPELATTSIRRVRRVVEGALADKAKCGSRRCPAAANARPRPATSSHENAPAVTRANDKALSASEDCVFHE
jgi:hypothetical protein